MTPAMHADLAADALLRLASDLEVVESLRPLRQQAADDTAAESRRMAAGALERLNDALRACASDARPFGLIAQSAEALSEARRLRSTEPVSAAWARARATAWQAFADAPP